MTVRTVLHLDKLLALTVTSTIQFDASISNTENFASGYGSPYGIKIIKTSSSTEVVIYAGGSEVHKMGDQILGISATNDYVFFDAVINNTNEDAYQTLLEAGVFGFDYDGKTGMILYRLNDERDKVTKNLTFVGYMWGKFSAPLGIKSIEIDVENYNIDASYNYIYIPRLKRYYFVTNIQLTTKDYTRLQLNEDVLMSWQSLIKQQNAYITRYENAGNGDLVDNRLPLEDVITTSYITPTAFPTGNLTNVTLNANISSNNNIAVCTVASYEVLDTKTAVTSPSGTSLPAINGLFSNEEHITFISKGTYDAMYYANSQDSSTASFVISTVWLPFDPKTAFGLASSEDTPIYANDKMLYMETPPASRWTGIGSHPSNVNGFKYSKGGSPYLIVADFYFGNSGGITFNNNFLDYEPYTVWEIYVPFVGWQTVSLKDVKNSRIIVYYCVDLHTGNGTAYIYNITKTKLIWSGSCQIGVVLATTNTNNLEINKQQQANQLNMIMSMLGSALAIGVGAISHNPVAIAGGVMSGTKAVAHTVNANMLLFEKATTSFGSGDANLHAPFSVVIRKNYHEKITQTTGVYEHIQGKPYNKYQALTSLTGYTEIGEIHFDAKGENIYSTEIDEIVALLKGGVVF